MLTFGQAGNRADDLAGISHSLRSSCPRLTCCVQRPGPCYVPCTTTPRCTLLSPASTSSLSDAPFSLPLSPSLSLSPSLAHVACVVCSPSTTWTGTHTKASCSRVGRTARSSTPRVNSARAAQILSCDLTWQSTVTQTFRLLQNWQQGPRCQHPGVQTSPVDLTRRARLSLARALRSGHAQRLFGHVPSVWQLRLGGNRSPHGPSIRVHLRLFCSLLLSLMRWLRTGTSVRRRVAAMLHAVSLREPPHRRHQPGALRGRRQAVRHCRQGRNDQAVGHRDEQVRSDSRLRP